MDQVKTKLSNGSDHYDDNNERQKLQITTEQSDCLSKGTISHFEDLSNELLYEIFDYLDYFHVYQAFYNLNQRFRNTLTHSNLPIKINLSSMSKSAFTRYNQDIIQPNTHRITLFHLSDIFMRNYVLSSIPKLTEFRQLQTLILYNIKSNRLESLLDQLHSLSLLSSLSISSSDCLRNEKHIYRQICRLPALKYCKLSLSGWNSSEVLPLCINEHSSLEHLIISNDLSVSQLLRLVSYVPHLHRLSIGSLSRYSMIAEKVSLNLLNYLTHVSLQKCYLAFDLLIQLIRDLFRNVQVLHLTADFFCARASYINANKWEQLITDHLPDLRVFDINFNMCISNVDNRLAIETEMNQFTSAFWIEKQWFFTYQFHSSRYTDNILFYSINPYRRKYFTLGQISDNIIDLRQYRSSLNSVKDVEIKSGTSITSCNNYFPNAIQLTFHTVLPTTSTSATTTLSHIVSLIRLTKLVIRCSHFSFRKLIKILCDAHNIHTIGLKTMVCYEKKNGYTLIKQSEDFRLVSQMNMVTDFKCDAFCCIEQIELLVSLCPRMQSLTTAVAGKDLGPVIQFLLDKNNPNTRYLHLLHFSDYENSSDQMNTLIRSEKLLDDYILMKVGSYFYLWW